jgi:enamine deaminase RidA (YjgF/YER057c/UK114 family)
MPLVPVNPGSLERPRGKSHGMKGAGELLFVAGQIGANRDGRLVAGDLVGQFAQALDNVLDVVWKGGGRPENVARMVVYVTDTREYRRQAKALGAAWRRRMGTHYPAMVLVEVNALLHEEALVEVEAIALV